MAPMESQYLDLMRHVLEHGHRLANHVLAQALGMTTNTFLQNVVRARRQLAACLEGKGLDMKEILS